MAAEAMFARAEAAGLATQIVGAISPGFMSLSDAPGAARAELQAEARSWADFWFAWLIAKQAASLDVAVTLTRAGKTLTTATVPDGGNMSTEMTMDDTVTLAPKPKDDHGDPTSDQVTFAADDNGTVLSWSTVGNVSTGTPVGEGTVNVTVTDPTAPQLRPTVITIDVGAGPTSEIQVDVQVNTGANAVPPPA